MKNLCLFMIFVLFHDIVLAAQTTIPAKSPVEKLHIRIHQQLVQVEREARLGKLTKDQAKTLKSEVTAVHQQEVVFLKGNNGQPLTDSQIIQLNQQLNTLSKSIPIR